MKQTNRLKTLDSLRGLAALGVLLGHFTYVYNCYYPYNFDDYFSLAVLTRGVELFFILSGFVIFYSIEKEKSVIQFLKKRFIRLFPTFWVCVFITYSIVSIFGLNNLEVTFKEFLLNLTMVPQLFQVKNVDNSYWTLIPELFFYLFMAVLLKFNAMRKIEWIGFIWICISIIHMNFYHIRFLGLFLNLDYSIYFMTGILLFKIKQNTKRIELWVFLLTLLIISIYSYRININNCIAILVIYGVFILFVFDRLKFLEFKILQFMGAISFPLYLIHQHVGYVIINYLRVYIPNMWVIVPPIFICVGIASLITLYLEKPLMVYLKKRML